MSLITDPDYLVYRIRNSAIAKLKDVDPFTSKFLLPYQIPDQRQCLRNLYLSVLYPAPSSDIKSNNDGVFNENAGKDKNMDILSSTTHPGPPIIQPPPASTSVIDSAPDEAQASPYLIQGQSVNYTNLKAVHEAVEEDEASTTSRGVYAEMNPSAQRNQTTDPHVTLTHRDSVSIANPLESELQVAGSNVDQYHRTDEEVNKLLALQSKSFHSSGIHSASMKQGLLPSISSDSFGAMENLRMLQNGSLLQPRGASVQSAGSTGQSPLARPPRRQSLSNSYRSKPSEPGSLINRSIDVKLNRNGRQEDQPSKENDLPPNSIVGHSPSPAGSLELLDKEVVASLMPQPGMGRPVLMPTSGQMRRRASSAKLPTAPAPDLAFDKREVGVLPTTLLRAKTPVLSNQHSDLLLKPSGLSTLFGRDVDASKEECLSMPCSASPVNPFATSYAKLKGIPGSNPIRLRIFLPFMVDLDTKVASKEPLQIELNRSATVEETIGYALCIYCSHSEYPPLPMELRTVSLWSLRIAEDDGSIDDDFPELDRVRKVEKYSFDVFALSHKKLQIKPVPRPSLNASPFRKSFNVPSASFSPTMQGAAISSASSPANILSNAPLIFLKIHLYSTLEVKQTTTLSFPADMVMTDVFMSICQKRKYDLKDYVLKMPDTRTDVPLQKTLGELKVTEFCVLKRSQRGAGDIFLRPPEELRKEDADDFIYQPSEDVSSAYKQFNVTQRLFMGRKIERLFTIDGDSIYLFEPETKGIFDALHQKTLSFHASSILDCTQIKKSAHFKIMVSKQFDAKSLDLEAVSPYEAFEIVTRVTHLIQANRTS